MPDVKDVQIVVYLRRQDQYLQSLYMQAVSSGREQSFAARRERVQDRGKYLAEIDRWADAVGSDAIVIRPYQRNGVIDTIADFIGLIGAEILTNNQTLRSNPSPRRELLHFVRAFNNLHVGVDQHRLFRTLIGRDPAYARSCDLLTYEESRALLENYAEENRLLIEKYYRDESVPLVPELVPFAAPDRWSLDSEQYYRLTVDVLDVLIKLVAEGRISPDRVRGSRAGKGKRSAEDGNAGGSGQGRRLRGNERRKRKAGSVDAVE